MKQELNSFLQERMPGFTPRESQQDMSELITQAIDSKQNALIEAGTGTGKTYAYLLPAIESDQKIIVSTGTKNLQDQLFQQDLPFINESFGKTTAILKGRGNYVCLDRLYKNINEISKNQDSETLERLVTVHSWSTSTRSGDLTEVLDEEDLSNMQRLVASNAENCLGSDCGHFNECHVYKARQRALEADIVVVNHHLFFADLALKEDDLGALLPQADVIILDEAHQVEEVARNFYGQRLSSGQLLELTSDVDREQRVVGLDDPELLAAAELMASVVNNVLLELKQADAATIDTLVDLDLVEDVDLALSDLISKLSHSAERSAGLAKCYSRACRLMDLFTLLTEPSNRDESAHWVELNRSGFVVHLLPLNVAEFLTPLLSEEHKTWLLVSATLATTAAEDAAGRDTGEKAFRHMMKSIGFNDGLTARYPSPFNFTEQVKGYVPKLPNPSEADHTKQLIATALPLIRSHTGRCLLLFTSHRALTEAFHLLQAEHDLAVMAQGALAKSKLIEKFRATDRAILLATHSFWEGVDLSGSELKLLMIDKLPFTSPEDPVFQAKLKSIDRTGGNSFSELSLPRAAITLKQGFGRLIRSEADQGLFVLGDPRLVNKPYGKVLRRCLPEFEWLDEQSAAIEYLENLP